MDALEPIRQGVADRYGIRARALTPLHQYPSDWRGVYRLEAEDGLVWVLRAMRHEEAVRLLAAPAAVLHWLCLQGYPAPTIRLAVGGEDVVECSGWTLFLTSYIAGASVRPDPQPLFQMGDTLGRLHRVELPPGVSASPLPISRLHPSRALPEELPPPEAVSRPLPAALSDLYAALYSVMGRVRERDSLPTAIVHGDCWYTNGIVIDGGSVRFIDWDGAGEGAAVLDLGYLLLTSHYDLDHPTTVRADPARIRAILDGYGRHRTLDHREREALADAICFPIALQGAAHLLEGDAADLTTRKIVARYLATDEIAAIARAHLGDGGAGGIDTTGVRT